MKYVPAALLTFLLAQGCSNTSEMPAVSAADAAIGMEAASEQADSQMRSAVLAGLTTRAERTDYRETARYQEVADFTDAIVAAAPFIHKTTFGYSKEGRALPLLVIGADGADAESVLAAGKTRIFIQANIHAGEVCGKEAMLLMLRDLASGEHPEWAENLVVLIAPIYNADGNEEFSLNNRPLQNGPVGGMGQRPNSDMFDLNRDHMKLDSPEARSLVRLFNDYDPHVIVDLHTTNGSHHAYHLTYSPPLNPNTDDRIDTFLRDKWLPDVTDTIRNKYGWEYYYYGNVPRRGEPGWYTFDYRARFNNNYSGLRNRMAILSEAYAYLTFEERVMATKYFVEEILDFATSHADEIANVVERAGASSAVGSDVALQATFEQSLEPVRILMGEVEEETNPYSGERMLKRLDVVKPEMMYEYGAFTPTVTTRAPRAYVIPASQREVIRRLGFHGIAMRALPSDSTARVEAFRVDSVSVSDREYQGHHETKLFGAYETKDATLSGGSMYVPVSQPLGLLAVVLLEPLSDDGFLAWELVDKPKGDDGAYPIVRIAE